ncbi:mandelate racemase/muconate lactonizing enzyme family protein [Haloglomus litoreum]|uniref:mandelate racemase/muconate lactonizing enzyme family protein n=1 Tax=Haloglomus litoreum TaxID=3034026 RepID=UPI0023E78684|nr:enolase C-terminal domain-like protein [Haloglomus sp. DT116]
MRVDPFALDLASPLTTARGAITEREGFVVRLAVDGTAGVGEAAPLPGWTESLDDCRAALECVAEALDDGIDPDAVLDGDGHRVDLGDAPAARHAVASAVLDARARTAGEPLYRVLAGEDDIHPDPVESVPVNATVGDGPPGETADAAADAVAAGFGTVKLKVGARAVAADTERVAAVRDRCPDVTLRADANGAWSADEAERALAAFAEHGVAYVEQPLPAAATDTDGADGPRDDLRAHAALRGRGVGVALDESLAVGADPVTAALDASAADALVLKPMALGGPDRALAAARAARAAGVEAVLTTTIDGALARATAVHAAAAVPAVPACGLATGDRLERDLLDADPAPVSDGRARVPEGPGVAGGTRWHRGRTDQP